MTIRAKEVFADTSYWVALVVKGDKFSQHAREWSLRLPGKIVTTTAVLLETTNTFSKPHWRAACIPLIVSLPDRREVKVVPLSQELWQRGWELFKSRMDKGWSLTDCISMIVMKDHGLHDVLTADHHFLQAGFHPLFLDPLD